MSIDGDSGILLDVAGSLGSTMLDDETAEASEVHIVVLLQKALLNRLHKTLNHNGHVSFLQAGGNCYLVDNVCFRHCLFFL